MTSSPLRPGASLEEELDYYKKQYEQLEHDLADFQASSKELEAQLEADIENSEKSERKLREENEKLRFEAEEWKGKNKSSRDEANRSQNVLQKEITQLREEKRGLELRLRDVEVVNDDYERQARNTEVSLEDLESKYNSAIEKGVMLEEEMRVGEQEREQLRIESQRLRDELGDLRVESEITLEKLRLAEQTAESLRAQRKPSALAVEHLRSASSEVASEGSGVTPSSPAVSTPPGKSDSASDAPTPPSPPLSDIATSGQPEPKTPMPSKPRRSLIPDAGTTPRPSGLHGPRVAPASRHTRGTSIASTSTAATHDTNKVRTAGTMKTRQSQLHSRPSAASAAPSGSLPRSESLYLMSNLRSRMQKIEERVHSARSKLPPPGSGSKRTPRGSPSVTGTPRTGSALSMASQLPGSVTVRRTSKRPSASRTSSYAPSDAAAEAEGHASDMRSETAASSVTNGGASTTDGAEQQHHQHRRRESHIKRLSYGIPRPASAMDRPPSALDRPPSAARERPPSAAANSRPASRQSLSNSQAASSGARPPSRSGRSSAMGTYSSNTAADLRRPRSSMGGSVTNGYATVHGTPRSAHHRTSTSVSELRGRFKTGTAQTPASPTSPTATMSAFGGAGRRATFDKGSSALAAAAPKSAARNGVVSGAKAAGSRTAMSTMGPPPRRKTLTARDVDDSVSEDVGETY